MGGGGSSGGDGLAGMMNAMGGMGGMGDEPSRTEMQGPPNIDDILRNVESKPDVQPASGFASSQAEPQINLDDAMNFSESDLDQAKGVKIKKNRKKNGKKEVYIDF